MKSYVHPFWLTDEAKHYFTPNERYPEGKEELFNALRLTCGQHVTEFGCGDGRLAEVFNPNCYFGYDPNPGHVNAARLNFPNHVFGTEYPGGNVVLAWNVFMHVPDEYLAEVIAKASAGASRLVIGEMMGHKWRRPVGPAPAFNREAEDYKRFGFVSSYLKLYVKRYEDFATVLCLDL